MHQDIIYSFQEFGIPYYITKTEFSKQYKVLVLKFHPDKGGNEEQMQRLNSLKDFINGSSYNEFRSSISTNYRYNFTVDNFRNIVIRFLKNNCKNWSDFGPIEKKTAIANIIRQYKEVFADLNINTYQREFKLSQLVSTNKEQQIENILSIAFQNLPNCYKFSNIYISNFLESQYKKDNWLNKFITPMHSTHWHKVHINKIKEKTTLSDAVFISTYAVVVQEILDKIKNYIVKKKKLSETLFSDALTPNIKCTASELVEYFGMPQSEVFNFLENYLMSVIVSNKVNKKLLTNEQLKSMLNRKLKLSEIVTEIFFNNVDDFFSSNIEIKIYEMDILILFRLKFNETITKEFNPSNSIKTDEEYFLNKLVSKYCLSKLSEYKRKIDIAKGTSVSIEDDYNDYLDKSWENEFLKAINEGNPALTEYYKYLVPKKASNAIESRINKAILTFAYITHKHILTQKSNNADEFSLFNKYPKGLANYFAITDKFKLNNN